MKMLSLGFLTGIVVGLIMVGAAYAQEVQTPTPTATPTSTPVPAGRITISVETNPESADVRFCFDARRDGPGDPADFCLEDDESRMRDFAPGEYSFTVDTEPGWTLEQIRCTPRRDGRIDVDLAGGNVTIDLDNGDNVSCEFRFIHAPTPTPQPTNTPAPTATSTPLPVPTPVIIPFVVTVVRDVPVFMPPAVQTPTAPVIRPPATGSAGLLD